MPQVGIDASGKAHALWTQYTGASYNDLCGASYVPGTGWSLNTQPVDTLSGGIGAYSLSVNSAGAASVVWAQNSGTVMSIFGARYRSGQGWGAPTALEASEAGSAYAPVVSLSTNGTGMATWYQKDAGGIRHIYANRWN